MADSALQRDVSATGQLILRLVLVTLISGAGMGAFGFTAGYLKATSERLATLEASERSNTTEITVLKANEADKVARLERLETGQEQMNSRLIIVLAKMGFDLSAIAPGAAHSATRR